MKIYLEIFWSFLKVTLSSFGGGYVLLPLLQAEIVRKRKWISDKDLLNYYALGQCTPGIISMNVAMLTGHKVAGRTGSLTGAFAVSFPCIVLVSLMICLLKEYLDNPYVVHAINGIKVYMAALIAHTIIDMFRKSVTGKRGALVFLLSLAAIYLFHIGVATVIVVSAFAGYLLQTIKLEGGLKK